MKIINPVCIRRNEFNIQEHSKDDEVWYVLYYGHQALGKIVEGGYVEISEDGKNIEFESPSGTKRFIKADNKTFLNMDMFDFLNKKE